ncbi:hypothetical protein [Pseudovibrio sp. SCP19]|uniref:hypothetical protein n=1 Tax=Pseudovibrio sp. SCP19 TaxID=3141374 RepID=UPI00333B7E54
MSDLTKNIKIPKWVLILVGLIMLTLLCAYFFLTIEDPKWNALFTGLLSSFIVSILIFYFSIQPLRELQKFHDSGVVSLLSGRHDKVYYSPIVSKSRGKVFVMGASCSRFVDDFLDGDADDHMLLDAMNRHSTLTVKLLVPSKKHMDDASEKKFSIAQPKLKKVREKFPEQFEVKSMDSPASHSFVITDNEFIGGPIFADDESKNSPAVHVKSSTPYARKHQNFFEREWNKGTDALES